MLEALTEAWSKHTAKLRPERATQPVSSPFLVLDEMGDLTIRWELPAFDPFFHELRAYVVVMHLSHTVLDIAELSDDRVGVRNTFAEHLDPVAKASALGAKMVEHVRIVPREDVVSEHGVVLPPDEAVGEVVHEHGQSLRWVVRSVDCDRAVLGMEELGDGA